MECPANDHPLVVLYRRVCKKAIGVDQFHRCVASVCSYWSDGKHSLFICRTGLHIHRCGRHACSLAVDLHDGAYTCPVSGYCHGVAYKHYATRDAKDRWVNTCSWVPTRKKRDAVKVVKPAVLHTTAVDGHVQSILRPRKRSSCRDRMFKDCLHRMTFQATIAAAIASYGDAGSTVHPQMGLLASDISAYIAVLRRRLSKTYSDITLVAVLLSMLVTGLTVRGVVVFPVVPCVVERAPMPVAYALVPGLQCRAMSHATRAIRGLFLNVPAIPPELVFPSRATEADGGYTNDAVGMAVDPGASAARP